MGSFFQFKCRFCQYKVDQIPVGTGKDQTLALRLFNCSSCGSIGSTWTGQDKSPRCAFCYDKEITLLQEKAGVIDCPKCQEPASLVLMPGNWE